MRRIKSKGMKPELTVRRLVHSMGYRFRLHVSDLPGKPDLVFPRLMKVIDVRGCFWHQHGNCIDSHIPKSRIEYWRPKLQKNRRRDKKNTQKLEAFGWKVLVVWECEVGNLKRLTRNLSKFLAN
jgi:DNA mismatch endonuclease (patch repair protein)